MELMTKIEKGAKIRNLIFSDFWSFVNVSPDFLFLFLFFFSNGHSLIGRYMHPKVVLKNGRFKSKAGKLSYMIYSPFFFFRGSFVSLK